jgi:DNA polymerase-3 subunit alpha
MDQNSGIQAISLTKPQSVEDLATINSVMRLMATERGAEQPLNIYARYKENIRHWFKEMTEYGLTQEQQDILHEFLGYEYGICATQEDLMSIIQHPAVGGMSLSFADRLRKAIAKKVGQDFDVCEAEFFTNAKEKNIPYNFVHYIWNVLFKIQRGYSFNLSHTLAYSMIGLQELNLAYRFPVLFWNTANLIVDSGAADEGFIDEWEENEDGNVSEPGHIILGESSISDTEEELDQENEGEEVDKTSGKEKTINKTVNYGKISTAIGKMMSRGIVIELPNINKSTYTFLPDVETNSITYGVKGITRIGDSLVKEIIANRPYKSFNDLISRIKLNKLQIINLIKSGIFDHLEKKDRREIMEDYLLSIADTKVRLTLQNMPMLIREDLIPEEMAFYGSLFSYNKYLKTQKRDTWYVLNQDAFDFYSKHFDVDDTRMDNGDYVISQTLWDKLYKKAMEPMRAYLKDETKGMLKKVNAKAISELVMKYADGSISEWEMDSLGFYFGEHELNNIDREYYGVKNFFDLPEEPTVARVIPTKSGSNIVLFDLCRIAGTVINKEKTKHLITLLTPEGVVNVKVWAAQFTKYDKQISVKQDDGKKKIMERSWFTRGNKLLITGIRRGDVFIPKVYKSGQYQEPFLLIKEIDDNGELTLQYSRYDDQ